MNKVDDIYNIRPCINDFDYYMNLVDSLDVSSSPNSAVFTSPGNRDNALRFAKLNGERP